MPQLLTLTFSSNKENSMCMVSPLFWAIAWSPFPPLTSIRTLHIEISPSFLYWGLRYCLRLTWEISWKKKLLYTFIGHVTFQSLIWTLPWETTLTWHSGSLEISLKIFSTYSVKNPYLGECRGPGLREEGFCYLLCSFTLSFQPTRATKKDQHPLNHPFLILEFYCAWNSLWLLGNSSFSTQNIM